MNLRKIFLLLVIFCITVNNVKAQDTFYGEFGLTGGCGFVLGDTNDFLFQYSQPLGGLYAKYKFNGRWETRLQLDGGLLGYNKTLNSGYVGLQALGEFNFFNYGVKKWEANYSWFSPCLVAGLGVVLFDLGGKPKFTMTLPMGVGMKFKLNNRTNAGFYWTVAKAFRIRWIIRLIRMVCMESFGIIRIGILQRRSFCRLIFTKYVLHVVMG